MADTLTRLAVLLLRPVERYHAWRWKRAYRAGKFRRPAEPKAAVTTKKTPSGFCIDCPDHEACCTGYPCDVVKRAAA